jgi:putative ABC transport system permease protein
MMSAWITGLIRTRGRALMAASAGIALALALLTVLGLFVSHSAETMTARAVSAVAPDWQVQLVGTTDEAPALDAIHETAPTSKTQIVNHADTSGFSSSTGGSVQTTGIGKIIGIDPGYRQLFPRQMRLLAGSFDGPLIAQQTAANLHAAPGDTVTVQRLGATPVDVKISGIVEMPSADQFFQIVGTSTQSAPVAPPDNIILVANEKWRELFESQLETMPQTAFRQIHISVDHAAFSGDPVAAYVEAVGLANNLSAKLAGEGLIANNLAARLDGVRQDALFAKVLFMFLGVPGAVVSVLLTMLVVQSSADRRRRDIALLQVRGAGFGRIASLVGLEALLVACLGSIAGLLAGWLIAHLVMNLPAGLAEIWWFVVAALGGFLSAALIFWLPSWAVMKRTSQQNVQAGTTSSTAIPAWKKLWLDIACLLVASAVFWQSSATGYRVVTAPEGVATATVDYKAYLAPALLWIGLALLLMRCWTTFMLHGKPVLARLITPLAASFSPVVAAAMSRERGRIASGVVLVALAFSFATSTAIFNATYEQQANVDATLTNGADVAVTGTTQAPASSLLDAIKKIAGVTWAEPMQHRFAYVGTDLQDIYGIDPASIGNATPMSNAYFTSGDAAATLAQLKATPNGVLVSDETVSDFQLNPGDTINLRLQNTGDLTYHAVPFTFIGVVREFPTAPTDSFLVANASYISAMTKNDNAETVLVKTSGNPAFIASDMRKALGPATALKVTDVSEAVHRIGSSLVAVDLGRLTALELAFALPIIVGALGLVFALGVEERRRSFAILLALGAKSKHLGAFLWSEALLIYVVGLLAGLAIGTVLAWVLVKMMTHVFDPPPDALSVPWGYLALLAITGLVAVTISVVLHLRKGSDPLSFSIRNI